MMRAATVAPSLLCPDLWSWGSTPAERQLPFACDRWLSHPDDVLFRAVDVAASAPGLFRWLCQLRVAPYSYDWIDNLGRRSPRHLIAGLDALEVGQRFMGFTLVDFEPDRHVTLHAAPFGATLGSLAVTYLIVPSAVGCRLVVKLLVIYPRWAPLRVALRAVLVPGDLVMMRKQLLTLKALAERDAR